jgi:hypothetical protein
MGTEISTANGVTPLLSKSLGSRDFQQHRATVAFELEVLARKQDRFGWERDRGTPAQDRLIVDWMDVLGDYPLVEVKAACRQAILTAPSKLPNEGHILQIIQAERHKAYLSWKHQNSEPPAAELVKEVFDSNAIISQIGFTPKTFGG